MKSIIAFADVHGNIFNLMKLIPLIERADVAVFAGDGFSSLEVLPSAAARKLVAVKGNCDMFCALPTEAVIEVGGVKIFVCHGHEYGVKSGDFSRVAEAAKRNGASIALFGHTHKYRRETVNGVDCVNLGTIGTSRTDKGGVYVKITVDGGVVSVYNLST